MDVNFYRQAEQLARQNLITAHAVSPHAAVTFERYALPFKMENTAYLSPLIDSMQAGRFAAFVEELGGLDADNLDLFIQVLAEYATFARSALPAPRVSLPLSSMIAHLLIYRKVQAMGPVRRILEVGPGCGFLSFFLKREASLEHYVQIESVEVFYILQNLVNAFTFQGRVVDHAVPRIDPGHFQNACTSYISHNAAPTALDHDWPEHCVHLPWWRQNDARARRYSVILSNANMNEFSREALLQYADLFRDTLEDDGVLFAQCLGGGALETGFIFQSFLERDILPVAFLNGPMMYADRYFALINVMFVKASHPRAERYRERLAGRLQSPFLDEDDPLSSAVFLPPRGPSRKRPSETEIAALVSEYLKKNH